MIKHQSSLWIGILMVGHIKRNLWLLLNHLYLQRLLNQEVNKSLVSILTTILNLVLDINKRLIVKF